MQYVLAFIQETAFNFRNANRVNNSVVHDSAAIYFIRNISPTIHQFPAVIARAGLCKCDKAGLTSVVIIVFYVEANH